jgi:hypothetical protein
MSTTLLVIAVVGIAQVTVPVLAYIGLAAFSIHRTGTTSGLAEVGAQVAAIACAGHLRFHRRSSPK